MRFFECRDVVSINKWRKRHGLEAVSMKELPAFGFIVPGVAAAFMRDAEGGVGIMDSIVSNPLCKSETRHRALDQLFTRLVALSGYSALIGFSRDEGTIQRAQRHGFTTSNHVLLIRNK